MSDQSSPKLTPAQWLVLERLAQGEGNAAIAVALGITLSTVTTHVHAIYQRLPHANRSGKRAAAVAWYLTVGRGLREQEVD
jgi:DNA-binding NarL/FixJ family response regulator